MDLRQESSLRQSAHGQWGEGRGEGPARVETMGRLGRQAHEVLQQKASLSIPPDGMQGRHSVCALEDVKKLLEQRQVPHREQNWTL